MKVDLTINSIKKRRRRLVHVVAMFFLIYTGADIMLPQYFCGGEEIGNLSIQGRVMASEIHPARTTTDLTITSSNDSQPNQSPDQVPHEEDCFCCCAHVLPGLTFAQIGYSEIKSPLSPWNADGPLSPALQSTYHPPRFV